MKVYQKSLLSIAALGLSLGAGLAVTLDEASAQDVKELEDDTWISLSGTVVSTSDEEFKLDYGDGIITVEMDDFDFFEADNTLLRNDQVIVYGEIEDDLFEGKEIEADSVFVENLRTTFFADDADKSGFSTWTVATPVVVGHAEVTGVVTKVSGREMTVSTGTRAVSVDTIEMAYNPLDEVGFLQVDEGDMVKVGGEVEPSLFDERELHADWIIKLD